MAACSNNGRTLEYAVAELKSNDVKLVKIAVAQDARTFEFLVS